MNKVDTHLLKVLESVVVPECDQTYVEQLIDVLRALDNYEGISIATATLAEIINKKKEIEKRKEEEILEKERLECERKQKIIEEKKSEELRQNKIQEEHRKRKDLLTSKTTDLCYTYLDSLLSQKRWLDADILTRILLIKASQINSTERFTIIDYLIYKKMNLLRVVNKKFLITKNFVRFMHESWLDEKSIEKIPREDIQIINRLWVIHSNSHFGFSIQKKIWQDVGGHPNAEIETEGRFENRIGWKNGENHINSLINSQNFKDISSFKKGYFPCLYLWRIKAETLDSLHLLDLVRHFFRHFDTEFNLNRKNIKSTRISVYGSSFPIDRRT